MWSLFQVTFDSGNSHTILVVCPLWGIWWGWSAPIQVTLCPIDSCYSLNRGIRHLERSFHLSSTQGGLSPPHTTLGDYHHPREYYHLSPCGFRIVTSICRNKRPAVHIWSTSSLTPFPHNNSGLVSCFYLKGYGLGALTMISPRKTVLSKISFPLLHYKSHAVKAEKQNTKEKIWLSSFTMILRRKTAKEKQSFLCFITSRVQWKHRSEKEMEKSGRGPFLWFI